MRRPRLKPCTILAWAWCLGMSLGSPLMAAPLALPEAIRAKLAEHPSLNARPFDIQWSALQRSGPCDQWEIDLPPRPRLLGALRVPVRCPSNPRLNQTATLSVSLMVPVLVAARDLAPGHVLQAGDWKWQTLDLAKLPAEVIESEQSAQNKEIVRNISSGRPLQLNDLRAITVIKTGDQVKLNIMGQGFSIDASAVALTQAAVGDTVRVRLPEGRVLQGVAVSAGVVEVNLDQR